MFNSITIHDTVELPADLLPAPTTAEAFKKTGHKPSSLSETRNSTAGSEELAAFYSVQDYNTAVASAIARKFLHRTLDGQGICIAIDHDEVAATSCNRIPYGQPAVWLDIKAQLIMFMPKVNTILRAQIMSQSPAGIRLSLHFYDHIYVPAHYLQEGSHFSTSRGVWATPVGEDEWNDYRTGDDALAVVRMVNFEAPQVQQALSQSYGKNTGISAISQQRSVSSKATGSKLDVNTSSRMNIIASFSGLALGPMVWYFDQEQIKTVPVST